MKQSQAPSPRYSRSAEILALSFARRFHIRDQRRWLFRVRLIICDRIVALIGTIGVGVDTREGLATIRREV